MRSLFSALLLCLLCLRPAIGEARDASRVRIAAAADLQFALGEIIELYGNEFPEAKLDATYGSSGKFRTQIGAGAPFDLFLSADEENARAVVKAGRASGDIFPFARGRLSLWVKTSSKLPLDSELKILNNDAVKKIAVGNAVHAPYGRIAEEALGKAGLLAQARPKLVQGESIAQAAQFVMSGAADIGLIATSLAEAPSMKEGGRSLPVAETLYTPLRQAGVLLKGPHESAAAKFRDFFLSRKARAVLASYGLKAQ